MRVILQRVTEASVSVSGEQIAHIHQGLLLFVGIQAGDTQEEIAKMAEKIAKLRIFEDDQHKMNLSIRDIQGEVLSVSQFTLLANTKRGNRPSFGKAEVPEKAKAGYEYFNEQLAQQLNMPIQTGQFGADMDVALHNDGPVTIFFDTKE